MTKNELIAKLKKVDSANDAEFASLVRNSMLVLGIDEMGMSSLMGMSRVSVRRWVSGKTSPHPVMRPQVFRTLLELAEREVA